MLRRPETVGRSTARRHRRGIIAAARPRGGFSLFEVVLAVGIFVGAMAMLSQIHRTGSRSAIRANLQSEAIVRCERCMNEVLSGVQPLESVSKTPFLDQPAWTYTINVVDSGIVNLLRVEAIVTHEGSRPDTTSSFQLVRFVRDPLSLEEPATAVVEEMM